MVRVCPRTVDIGERVSKRLAERDDARYWEADFYTPRTARAQHWLAQVSGRFVDLFGELRLVGRFSNGEAIFERS